MNLELLQTVDQSYPEHNDGILDSGSEALTCAFNRRGTMLAVGCNDGRIAIWDFMTRGIARMCNVHIHPITSLSWNRSGRKILSSSTDWTVILWDVASGECECKFRFPAPILKAQFHPRDRKMFLVCPMRNVPIVVKYEGDEYKHYPLPTEGEPEHNIVASFDRRGDYIVTGSSKGKLVVIDTKTLTVLTSFKTGSATPIKSIEFARRGSNFLVNSADRVIRVYDMDQVTSSDDADDIEALQKLQDLVNRTQWKKCTFSGDGDFIVAGSHRQHALYIWDKATGSLVKMLTGQKGETLLDVVWHPVRPVILSISTGVVNVWSQAHVELWSAYAPNFKELDENVEYEEREDEFDIEDEDDPKLSSTGKDVDHNAEIGVVSPLPIPAFCSSAEDSESPLDWLPMAPEIEDPEEPGWGQLEPSLNNLLAVEGNRKRPGPIGDADVPAAKQPRTVDIDLPHHCEQDVVVEQAQKDSKVKGQKENNKKAGKGPGKRISKLEELPTSVDASDKLVELAGDPDVSEEHPAVPSESSAPEAPEIAPFKQNTPQEMAENIDCGPAGMSTQDTLSKDCEQPAQEAPTVECGQSIQGTESAECRLNDQLVLSTERTEENSGNKTE